MPYPSPAAPSHLRLKATEGALSRFQAQGQQAQGQQAQGQQAQGQQAQRGDPAG